MLFGSLTFLFLFFPLVSAVYYIAPNLYLKNIILLLFSFLFYAWGEPVHLFLMMFSILLAYLCGLMIEKGEHRRFWLFIGVAGLLGMLFYFKYWNFIFGHWFYLEGLLLPIGISFYTFQTLSYIIDVAKGEVAAQHSLLKLATYVSLFPQLIAGPIVRYCDVERELSARHSEGIEVNHGLERFIIGLAKKVLLANRMALLADTIYGDVYSAPAFWLWMGALAYTFQIYYDFSGYSDMAIGLGWIFGFHFQENFNLPYRAKNITDFWRRWHISLGSWFRDYVYIPLGGNRVSRWRWLRNLLIVWVLTGLWHGASFNFILWGLYFACLLIIEKVGGLSLMKRLPIGIAWGMTFLLILIGWVIFRVEGIKELVWVLTSMISGNGLDVKSYLFNHATLLFSMCFLLPAALFSIKSWRLRSSLSYFLLYLLCLVLLVANSYNPFIYFRF